MPKLYYTMWTRARAQATHDKLLELGLESPFERLVVPAAVAGLPHTTRVDDRRRVRPAEGGPAGARTQIDPASPFWFALPDEVAAEVHPWEEYHLARATVQVDLPETDLFAGIGQPAYDAAGSD